MGFVDAYNYYIYERADPRTANWLFVSSPVPITLISFAYLYFVLGCGKRYIEKRPAFSLLTFTKLYNVFQIVANTWFIYNLYQASWFSKYGFVCGPFSYNTDPDSMRMVETSWWVLMLKIVDYSETVVFLLRKKQRQISFLHLYHHITTVYLVWLIVKYFATGNTMFLLVINCGVHVIMYTYYFLSTLGPTVQSLIAPLKRSVTIIQMVQFVILIVFSMQAFLPYCKASNADKRVAYVLLTDLVMNFYLFYKFYKQTYIKPKRK